MFCKEKKKEERKKERKEGENELDKYISGSLESLNFLEMPIIERSRSFLFITLGEKSGNLSSLVGGAYPLVRLLEKELNRGSQPD